MSVSRRKFLKSSVTSGAALMLPDLKHLEETKIILPAGFTIKIMATNWGYDGTIEQFCAKAKQAGYDGIEVGWPTNPAEQKRLFDTLKANQLSVGFLVIRIPYTD